MRVYFLSSRPAALYVGGAYFGKISDFERFAELSLGDGLPVLAQAEGAHPIGFFLDESLPLRPPHGVDVYRLPAGLALHINGWQSTSTDGRAVCQQRDGNLLATVVQGDGVRVVLDTPNSFFTADLPPSFAQCTLDFVGECLLAKSQDCIAVLSLSGEMLLSLRYLSFARDGERITLTLPLSDRYGRTAEATYRLHEGRVEREHYALRQSQDVPVDGLIAYALFESVRIGAEPPFLCEELQKNPDGIKAFLGNFTDVVPTQEPCVCLLTYPLAPHLFDVRPFTVTVENGQITDVRG